MTEGKGLPTRPSGRTTPEGMDSILKLQQTIEQFSNEPYSFSRLHQELKQVVATQRIEYEELLGEMVETIENRLPKTSGVTKLPTSDALTLADACHQIRCHMISVALLKAKDQTEPTISSKVHDMVTGMGGLSYGRIDNEIILLIPRLRDTEHCNQVTQELLHVYERTKLGNEWILDFSLVQEFPSILFLGNLAFYKRQLSEKKGKLSIAWLNTTSINPQLKSALVSALNLKEIHSHLFSRNLWPRS